MKIVVIGGTGRIGSRVVALLTEEGHEAVPGSPSRGIDAITGEGLADAMAGATVVVDVSNSPSLEYASALEFFETSGRNLAAAEAAAGVGHHVALSIIGTSELARSYDPTTNAAGYFEAKRIQEARIAASPIPHTIVRATQFHEFVTTIADEATQGTTVRLPPVGFQPIAADDVATLIARIALDVPADGIVEIGGPERHRFDELVRHALEAIGDPREVVADPDARYFGATLGDETLVPGPGATLGAIRFEDWLRASRTPAVAG
jgi:uncharacterized protein YbjT (DUF2867 family)